MCEPCLTPLDWFLLRECRSWYFRFDRCRQPMSVPNYNAEPSQGPFKYLGIRYFYGSTGCVLILPLKYWKPSDWLSYLLEHTPSVSPFSSTSTDNWFQTLLRAHQRVLPNASRGFVCYIKSLQVYQPLVTKTFHYWYTLPIRYFYTLTKINHAQSFT